MTRIDRNGLAIDATLHDFLIREALPGTGIDADRFFAGFSAIVHDLAPKNRALLAKRDTLQAVIDDWYRKNGAPSDMEDYEAFLREIGYHRAGRVGLRGLDRRRRCGDRDDRRPATRRAGHERALCAQRRQCPLGLALRCALRHRRHSRGRMAPRRARATIRSVAKRSLPGFAIFSTPPSRSSRRHGRMSPA